LYAATEGAHASPALVRPGGALLETIDEAAPLPVPQVCQVTPAELPDGEQSEG
jgi:hypothetical protein